MIIVGIDASSNKTGMSVFRDDEYITHILIDCHKTKDSKKRIQEMMLEIRSMLNEYNPDKIVMEECMLKTNIDTVKKLSYIAGAVISWAAEHNAEFEFKLPSEWRKRVGIVQGPKVTRDKLKQEAIDMVKEKFGLDVTDDEGEATLLAYSVTHNEDQWGTIEF